MVIVLLSAQGYTVEGASTGQDALQKYMEKPVDVVILDLIMPDQDGLETMRELRKRDPKCKILVMSGTDQLYLKVARHLGANQTISKPIDPDELVAKVRELVA